MQTVNTPKHANTDKSPACRPRLFAFIYSINLNMRTNKTKTPNLQF